MRPNGKPVALLLALAMSGCGITTPRLKDPPLNYNDAQNNAMVQAIIASVKCELQLAVTGSVNDDLENARLNHEPPVSDFLSNWGVETLLTLTVKESSTISPSTVLLPPSIPSSVLSITGGFGVTATAVRIEKINAFYTIKELYIPPGAPTCSKDVLDPSGSIMIQSDLQIANLLTIKLDSISARQAGKPVASDKNTLSHEVSFQAIYNGNLTPSWKLVRATVFPNQLFSASRDQTHDVILTFGPLSKAKGGRSLIDIAEQTHISSQTTSGFLNGLRYFP